MIGDFDAIENARRGLNFRCRGDTDSIGSVAIGEAGLTAIRLSHGNWPVHQVVGEDGAGAWEENVVLVAGGLLRSGAGEDGDLRSMMNGRTLRIHGVGRGGLGEITLRIRYCAAQRAGE